MIKVFETYQKKYAGYKTIRIVIRLILKVGGKKIPLISSYDITGGDAQSINKEIIYILRLHTKSIFDDLEHKIINKEVEYLKGKRYKTQKLKDDYIIEIK